MRIQHNIMAMNAYRNYGNNTSALSKNLEKLSSGYRINRAGDDAAGLAISEKMRAQIQGLNAAQKNVKDAISFVKTAEGAMQEIQDMLSRMKYLATQSANGTYEDKVDRKALQDEVNSLLSEIDRIAASANFNDIHMLAGGGGGDDEGGDSIAAVQADFSTKNDAGVDKVSVDFAKDVTDDQKKALNEALSKATLKVKTTDAGGNANLTTGDKITISGLPTGYTAKFKDAKGDWVNLTDGGDITVGTSNNEFDAAQTAFEIQLFDDKGEVATITITPKTGGFVNDSNGSNATKETEITFAEADDTSKLARAEGTGDGDGDGKILKGTTIEYSFKGFSTQPSDNNTIKIGDKEYKFVTGTPSAGEVKIGSDFDETLDNLAKAIAADKIFDAKYDKATSTLTLTTTVDYDDENAFKTATTVAGGAANPWTAGVTQMTNTDNVKVTPYDDGENDDTGAGGGFYQIDMQIGDSSEKYDTMTIKIQSMSTGSIGVSGLDISTLKNAHGSIETIKKAINTVSSVRGQLGAYQNRLEHTANNLSVMTENIQDAESTIRDTDVAEEMMAYTKNNILIQSAQAMLAQANAVPQGVLQLLG